MGLFKSRGKHARGAKGADFTEIAETPTAEAEEGAVAPETALADGADAPGETAADAEAQDASGGDQGQQAGQDVAQEDRAEDDGQVQTDSDAGDDDDPETEGGDRESEPIGMKAAVALFDEIPSKKKHKGLKVFGIVAGSIAGLALIAYVVGAVVFMGRFLPNTTLGTYDVSLKTNDEVAELLDAAASSYRLDVSGGGFAYRATASDLGLSIDSGAIVSAMHADLNEWAWPVLILQPQHDETDLFKVRARKSVYEEGLKATIAAFNETATPPTNATIAYDAQAKRFVVVPEQIGTQLDEQAILVGVSEAISSLEPKVVLGQEDLVQPTVLSTDERLVASAELATGLTSATLELNLGGIPVGEVGGETLSEFIAIDENLAVTFREDALNAWADSLAQGFNTVGTERLYTRGDGKNFTVSGGVYGWEIDTEALKNAVLDGIRTGAETQIDIPCIETAAAYNGPGQRDWGARYIDVDLGEQYVRFFGADGSIIWESECISGKPDGVHNTVEGVWTVNARQSPSKLVGYENGKKIYETMVTYWMPFEGNSIGFHDATWQPSFGGSMYANGYGSHGCVNLSYNAAQSLYGMIEEGDVVVVHY